MTDTGLLSRRGFIVGTGATGLTIGILASCAPSATEPDAPDYSDLPPNDEVNAWVHIDHDDTVTVRIARSEMGQGTLTGLAQLVADELDCDWDKVTTVYPTPGENLARERVWRDYSTGGSQGIRGSQDYVREGAAAAKAMLIEAAANEWGVPASECTSENSVITHGPSGQTTTYGKVAGAASQLAPPLEVTVKDPSDWKIIGQAKLRLDTADKLNGKQVYGADIQLDGLLNASIRQAPKIGATMASFDASAIEGMPGVEKVVAIKNPFGEGNNAVAVIADTWWHANKALDALPIEWEGGVAFSTAEFEAELDEGLTAEEAFVGNGGGDLAGAFASADQIIEATYNMPFQNHACMEPMNTTALYTEDRCEIWCPTQNGEAALAAVSEASGLPIEQCEVYKIHLGGGFGRRGAPDYVNQAVQLAMAMPGTPVKLLWTREEDMIHGFFHPTTKGRVRGSLDADGNLTGLHVRISGQSILAALIPQALQDGVDYATFQGLLPSGVDPRLEDQTMKYSFDNFLVDHAMRNPPVRPGFWRGVNLNQNAIYLECFMDELAHAAGRDPLEFRLAYLGEDSKAGAVLQAVAERSGWGSDDGKARGLCVMHGFGSYVAACAEVTVDDEGVLSIDKIVAATDPGHAVNPQQIEAQVEGSFVYGLSAMLFGEITFEDGVAQEQNFDTFNSMRIADMPEVETIVMPSGGFWGGVGEPTIAVAAPAVLNAIYAATGNRVRKLPLKDQNLRNA
ncbi:MAG: molybdopterin cofactor-binding domain-containing protein [Pseudomonadota bacterium]